MLPQLMEKSVREFLKSTQKHSWQYYSNYYYKTAIFSNTMTILTSEIRKLAVELKWQKICALYIDVA